MSKKENLNVTEVTILRILENHKGKRSIISAKKMIALIDIEGWPTNMETRKRMLREWINHLSIEHRCPIGSADGKYGGYYMFACKKEAEEFYQRLRKRGLTALTRAARAIKSPEIVEATQYVIGELRQGEKIKGGVRALGLLAQHVFKNPKLYADQIKKLKSELAPYLVDQEYVDRLKAAAGDAEKANLKFRELINSI